MLQVVGEILDLEKPEVLETFAGEVFKGMLDVSIFVGAFYSIYKEYLKSRGKGLSTFLKSAGGALAIGAFVVNILGTDILESTLGIEKGWPVIILDVLTLIFALVGVKEYLQGAKSVQEAILDLFADITKSLEKALTIIGLFGTSTAVGLHIAGGKWSLTSRWFVNE